MRHLRACVVATCVAALACHAPPRETAPVEHAGDVGFRLFDATDPLTHEPLPIIVFYPASSRVERPASVGPYRLAAAHDVPIRDGVWPLIVISHGHGGSMLGHHDLAETLARHGYVVAAVEHVGDNWHDASGFRTDRVLLGRAYQMSTMIDAVLADANVGAHVDRTRIGAAGFSVGGYTSLLLVGGRPDFTRGTSYCARHADDDEICGGGPQRATLPSPRPTNDPRVRAAFVMAPLGIFFGPDAFKAVTAPVYLSWAGNDRVLLPDENAEPVMRALPTLAGSHKVEGAGHFVFLAPCSSELAAAAPPLCEDAPGIDRAAVHRQLADDAVTFFDRTLARIAAR